MRIRSLPLGWLGALLAIGLQLFVYASAMPAGAPRAVAALDQVSICGFHHADTHLAPGRRNHVPPCVACPGCQAVAHAAMPLPAGGPALAMPYQTGVALLFAVYRAPPTTGPPRAALPRGPPATA